jgi:hypothetical protein
VINRVRYRAGHTKSGHIVWVTLVSPPPPKNLDDVLNRSCYTRPGHISPRWFAFLLFHHVSRQARSSPGRCRDASSLLALEPWSAIGRANIHLISIQDMLRVQRVNYQ